MCDRDGTLASVKEVAPIDREPESWRNYNAALPFDAPVPGVVKLLQLLDPYYTIIVVSGRAQGDYQGDTHRYYQMLDWLRKHDIPFFTLKMRKGGDTRRDSIVKREIYDSLVSTGLYDIQLVIDDRPQVIEMWESVGLPVLKVADPVIPAPITQQERVRVVRQQSSVDNDDQTT